MEQVHAHHDIPGFDEGVVDSIVGWSTRQRLYVHENIVSRHIGCGEGLGTAPAGEGLDDVDVFDALVVAWIRVATVIRQPGFQIEYLFLPQLPSLLGRVTLGVDILESRSQRLADRQRGSTFGGD